MPSRKNHLRAEQCGTNCVPTHRSVPVRLPNLVAREDGHQVAWHVLPVAGKGWVIAVTVDRQKRYLGIATQICRLPDPRAEQLAAMDRIQERSNMCRLDRDCETGAVWLRAGAALTRGADAREMLSSMLADAGIVLSDDRLQLVVNG